MGFRQEQYCPVHTSMIAGQTCIPKLISAAFVHSVRPALIDVDKEHQVVPEHTEAVQPGHLDHKGKQVIHDGVQELVGHLAPGQSCHTLQLVVDVQLQQVTMLAMLRKSAIARDR